MWGFVWHLSPDQLMRFASRGPDHTVRSGCQHHPYWCDMDRNGMRDVSDVARLENAKAQRIWSDLEKRIKDNVCRFSICATRLASMLPVIENNMILQLGEPVFSLPDAPVFVSFHDHESHEDCARDLSKQYDRSSGVHSDLRNIVRSLHVMRCLRSQLGPQRLTGLSHCMNKLLAFLGRAYFLPPISGFVYKEIEAPLVIEELDHDELPAAIDPQMASLNVRHKLADNIQAISEQELDKTATVDEDSSEPKTEKIHVLEYNRHPEAFRQALCDGPALQQCRYDLEAAGCKWVLGSGAKMFVHPHQYAQTCVALVEQGFNLRPFNVVVAESLEYNVQACLEDLSHRQGARVKNRTELHEVALAADACAEMSEGCAEEDTAEDVFDVSDFDKDCWEGFPFAVSRTFLCVAPRLRNSQSVTQSTTEAHDGGRNPRRVLMASSSDQ